MSRTKSILAVSLLALSGGCNAPVGDSRAITGQLAAGMYSLDNPIVVAQATDLRAFFAPVSASGTFRLPIFTGATYRISIANSTRSGSYAVVSAIVWSTETGASRWAHVRAGGVIEMGTLRPDGAALSQNGMQTSNGSSGVNDQSGGQGQSGDARADEHDDVIFCEVGAASPALSLGDGPLPARVEGDDGAAGELEAENAMLSRCNGQPPAQPAGPGGQPGQAGAPCSVNADCANMMCSNSTCQSGQMQ